MSKKLNKDIAAFNCVDWTSLVLWVAIGFVFIISFATTFGAPVAIASASFSLVFSFSDGVIKKFSKNYENREK